MIYIRTVLVLSLWFVIASSSFACPATPPPESPYRQYLKELACSCENVCKYRWPAIDAPFASCVISCMRPSIQFW